MPAATSSILLATGTGVTIGGILGESRAQSEAARFDAAVARRQAQLVGESAALQERSLRKQKRRFLGRQRALFAKAGVTSEGSPLEVISDSASELELDILTARFNAQVEQQFLLSQARQDERRARQIRRAGFIKAAGVGLKQSAGFIEQNFPA